MIRYSCDLCGRNLDPREDLRYVVKMEIYAAMTPLTSDECDDDRDHLQDLQEVIERMEDVESDQIGEDVCQQLRFDLCPECRRRFVQSPLGREIAKLCDFSQN